MIDFELVSEFLKANMLIILIPLLIFILMFAKSFRKLLGYFIKNTVPLAFFIALSFICSLFGYTISINIFSMLVTLALGLPGISLILFLSLIV